MLKGTLRYEYKIQVRQIFDNIIKCRIFNGYLLTERIMLVLLPRKINIVMIVSITARNVESESNSKRQQMTNGVDKLDRGDQNSLFCLRSISTLNTIYSLLKSES